MPLTKSVNAGWEEEKNSGRACQFSTFLACLISSFILSSSLHLWNFLSSCTQSKIGPCPLIEYAVSVFYLGGRNDVYSNDPFRGRQWLSDWCPWKSVFPMKNPTLWRFWTSGIPNLWFSESVPLLPCPPTPTPPTHPPTLPFFSMLLQKLPLSRSSPLQCQILILQISQSAGPESYVPLTHISGILVWRVYEDSL